MYVSTAEAHPRFKEILDRLLSFAQSEYAIAQGHEDPTDAIVTGFLVSAATLMGQAGRDPIKVFKELIVIFEAKAAARTNPQAS